MKDTEVCEADQGGSRDPGPTIKSGWPSYGRTPRLLLRDPSVSRDAKAVYAYLEDYASPGSPRPFPSAETIGADLGASAPSVRRWLTELAERGWITKHPRRGPQGQRMTSEYELHVSPGQRKCAPVSEGTTRPGARTALDGSFAHQRAQPARTSERSQRAPVREEVEPLEVEPLEVEPEEENHYVPSAGADGTDWGPIGDIVIEVDEPPKLPEYSADFERVWAQYPRKLAKAKAWKAWKATLRAKRASVAEIESAVGYYADHCTANGLSDDVIMHGATFFGPDYRWQDYSSPPAPRALHRPTRLDAVAGLDAAAALVTQAAFSGDPNAITDLVLKGQLNDPRRSPEPDRPRLRAVAELAAAADDEPDLGCRAG